MILKKEKKRGPIEIDLTGPDGNVFVLMGIARKLARKLYDETHPDLVAQREHNQLLDDLGMSAPKDSKTMSDLIVNKMMESHYDNALEVMEHYFGDYIIMWK